MEKKNVNLNNEENMVEEKKTEKFGTKVKNGAVKAWNSKPARHIRSIVSTATLFAAGAIAVYGGTSLAIDKALSDGIHVTFTEKPDSGSDPEVPFVEAAPTEPVEDTAE